MRSLPRRLKWENFAHTGGERFGYGGHCRREYEATPGIAGKLFGTLGRNGINVIACAQGASETNISFVVDSKSLRKSLNVIHDSFFLSEYQVLNLFICEVGTVGGSLIEQIHSQRQKKLMQENGLQLNVVGIADASKAMFGREGVRPGTFS